MNDEYLIRDARAMIASGVSFVGCDVNNSLAGSLASLQRRVPRWAAEAAVRSAVARGTTFRGARVSFRQADYLAYVLGHAGCCVADVDRACRQNSCAGHTWVYASVRRLVRRGLLLASPGPGNRVMLRVPSMETAITDSK